MALDLRPRLAAGLVLERLPALDAIPPLDAAERLRGRPGLVLLESARPGRRANWSYLAADPLVTLERGDRGGDPFATARRQLHRMMSRRLPAGAPDWTGGLAGYLAYDLGRRFEHLPTIAAEDQPLPELRLGLYDLVVAWDRRQARAWLVGRAVDGDLERLRERRAHLLARLLDPSARASTSALPASEAVASAAEAIPTAFTADFDRRTFETMVERVRDEIARGEIYQANVARRLVAPFEGDPWRVYRRLRTGDPVTHAAYLDLGQGRAILSASPEPFLALDADGRVATDPIKGTRPRGATPEEDRELACELLASAKDRAENVMIVDVLRNDLGRVCLRGSIRVPRLCRLERTGAVQHLVSTVTGQLAPEHDAFDLLAASFPGGSITGAPKIRAMEIIEALEPVRRGAYTGTALWIGADGAMGASILIRTFVADGRRLTLHVGGGMTWRSDPAEEYEETVAKARGPLSALGAMEVVDEDDGAGRPR
jgi:para-aminobenzoate synthetase component I